MKKLDSIKIKEIVKNTIRLFDQSIKGQANLSSEKCQDVLAERITDSLVSEQVVVITSSSTYEFT
jgi:hypothetical protein|tara:strand:- start:616 stop:810 length:195 start_codon:yes stop_codon:yes gene_type:complete